MGLKIVVGVDGSESAQHAVAWCAAHAQELNAEIVVVHAIEAPPYTGLAPPYIWLRAASPAQREARRDRAEREWCTPLVGAGVPFRVEVADGQPADALMHVARAEDAALVVTGRRGLGGLKEHIVGSTSHQLSHSLDRPLLIVP